MSTPKTSITGEVAKCDIKTSKAGKEFAELHIEVSNKKRDGSSEAVIYIATAFAYHAEKFKSLRVGDYVTLGASVEIDYYKPEWPKVKLIVDSIEVLNAVVPSNPEKPDNQPTASETKELAESLEEPQLPF